MKVGVAKRNDPQNEGIARTHALSRALPSLDGENQAIEATVEGKFPAEEVVQVWMTPGLRMRSSRNPGGALGERSHLPHSGTTGAGRTPSNVAT
jgi:hypothetical protein